MQLERTRWVQPQGEPLETTAERLGVTTSVLEEARKHYEKTVERGRLGSRFITESVPVIIKAPRTIHEEWVSRCAQLRLDGSAVLRTLIHRLLLSRETPRYAFELRWVCHGAVHELKAPKRGTWPYRIRARVSRGAKSALKIRSERLRTTETALVRAQIIEFLERRIARLPHVVTSEQMHSNVNKYFLGKKES